MLIQYARFGQPKKTITIEGAQFKQVTRSAPKGVFVAWDKDHIGWSVIHPTAGADDPDKFDRMTGFMIASVRAFKDEPEKNPCKLTRGSFTLAPEDYLEKNGIGVPSTKFKTPPARFKKQWDRFMKRVEAQ
jgi:hypothetical protein